LSTGRKARDQRMEAGSTGRIYGWQPRRGDVARQTQLFGKSHSEAFP